MSIQLVLNIAFIAIIVGVLACVIGPALKRAIIINVAWARYQRARARSHRHHYRMEHRNA